MAAAQNQQAPRAYPWLEKTDVVFKGEVRLGSSRARYGPDGRSRRRSYPHRRPEESGACARVIEKKTAR